MIQRIQSVYLVLVAGLMLAMLFLPVPLHCCAVLGGLVGLVAAIALTAVFLYKRRLLQIKLCVVNILLLIGFYGAYFLLPAACGGGGSCALAGDAGVTVCPIAMVIPAVAIVLSFLAIRGIKKDEKLVKSYDRLR